MSQPGKRMFCKFGVDSLMNKDSLLSLSPHPHSTSFCFHSLNNIMQGCCRKFINEQGWSVNKLCIGVMHFSLYPLRFSWHYQQYSLHLPSTLVLSLAPKPCQFKYTVIVVLQCGVISITILLWEHFGVCAWPKEGVAVELKRSSRVCAEFDSHHGNIGRGWQATRCRHLLCLLAPDSIGGNLERDG